MSDIVKLIFFVVVPAVLDAVLIVLFLRGLMILKERKAKKDKRLVSLSPLLLWVGIVSGIFFTVPVYFMDPGAVPIPVPILFEVFGLLSVAMILAYCNETVVYDSLEFTSRNFLGVKRTCSYSDITCILWRRSDVFLYCGTRRIRLDTMASGKDEFVRFADRIYSSRNGESIPPRESSVKDPMRGNLDAPWVYLFCYSLFIAIIIAGVSFVGCAAYNMLFPRNEAPDDCTEIITSFSSGIKTAKDHGTLLLYADGYEKPFAISELSGYEIEIPEKNDLCSGNQYVVLAREQTSEFYIYAVSTVDGKPLISVPDRNIAYRNCQLPAVTFLFLILISVIPYPVFGIIVGRHPEKYPVKFRRVFYRDDAWSISFRIEEAMRKNQKIGE